MKIKKQLLFNNYKDIQKKCYLNGVLLPTFIRPGVVPDKYKLNFDEIESLNVDNALLNKSLRERYAVEQSIVEDRNDDFKTLTDYWEYEIKQFLYLFPEFNDIFA